jgi:hypothetical protein
MLQQLMLLNRRTCSNVKNNPVSNEDDKVSALSIHLREEYMIAAGATFSVF